MIAQQFYHANQKDGRAFLFMGSGERFNPSRWLILVGHRLILCADVEIGPAIRFVDDQERVVEWHRGGYSLVNGDRHDPTTAHE